MAAAVVGDDVSGAAVASGGHTVPNGEEQIRLVDHQLACGHVGIRVGDAVVAAVDSYGLADQLVVRGMGMLG